MSDHDFEPDHFGRVHYDFHHADPDRKLPIWFWLMLVGCLSLIGWMSVARYVW